MATNIDELVIQIRADTKQLTKALDKVKKKTKDAGNSGKKGFAGFTKQLGKVKGVAMAATAAIVAIGAAVIPIAKVGMAFEDLQISLNTVFGGIEGGKKAFDQVISFAETTPFQIEDVTKAFIRLKSAGLEPNIEMLKTFGDAASIAGNATEAFASLVKIASKATGGGLGLEELEQLETQGIAVYPILRRQLGLTRDKIADFGKTTEGAALIIEALQAGLKKTTGGTMAARMENLSTKVSNLQISFKKLGLAIFQGGLGDVLKGMTDRLTNFVNESARALDIQNKLARGETRSASDNAFEIDTMARRFTPDMGGQIFTNENLGAKTKVAVDLIPELDDDGVKNLLAEVSGFIRNSRDIINKASGANIHSAAFMEGEAEKPYLEAQQKIRDALLARIAISDKAREAAEALIDKDKQIADLYEKGRGMNAVADLDKLQEKFAESTNAFLELDELTAKLKIAPKIMVPKLDDNGEAIVDAVTGKIEEVRKYSEAVVAELVEFVGEQRKVIQDGLDLKDLNALKEKYGEIAGSIQGTVTPAQALKKEIDAIALALETDKDAFMQMFPEMTLAEVKEGLATLRLELTGMQDDAKNTTLSDQYADIKSAVEGTVTPFEALKSTILGLETAINSGDGVLLEFLFGARTPEEIQAVMVMLKDELKDLGETAEDTSKTLGGQLQQAVTNSANAFTTNFVNALMEGKNALGSFKDFAKSMVSQIISIFLQMAVVNEILNKVFNLTGSDAFPTFSKTSSSSSSAGNSYKPRLAGGGAYQKGVPTLVGERGPELIIPNTGGRVMNGMNTKSAMGGGSTVIVNQSLNFSTGVVGTVRAEIQKMLPTIAEVSKASVLDASRRGGNFRKGLLGA